MYSESPSTAALTLPVGLRLCEPHERAQIGDFCHTDDGWVKLLHSKPSYCKKADGMVYGTKRKAGDHGPPDPDADRRYSLTDEQIREIRQVWDSRPTQRKLAQQYGTTRNYIQDIVSRRKRKNVK